MSFGDNHYQGERYLIPFTKENAEKLGVAKEAQVLFDILEKKPPEDYNEEALEFTEQNCDVKSIKEVQDFRKAFKKLHKIKPSFVFLGNQLEMADGVADDNSLFISFKEKQKFVKIVKPEWKKLPIKPVKSKWAEYLE